MENNTVIFGTYILSNDGLTLSYNAPSILPSEYLEKVSFNQPSISGQLIQTDSSSHDALTPFDELLKGVLSVPKPKN